MPEGGILLIRLQTTQNHVFIQFIDQGIGIPEDMIRKLGEPFYTTKAKGTGLGLMITHNILEAHNGSIHFSSVVGNGTTVHVELPLSIL
jgi:signal transduction histidine kinase